MTENNELDSVGNLDAQGEDRLIVAQAESAMPDQTAAVAPAPSAELTIAVEDGDIVRLPADASIDAPRVNGANLEFVQPDGSVIVVPGGAVQGLTIFIGTVEIPPQTVAALFTANDIQAAAGPAGAGGPGSSGGNFEVPVGAIGQALAFGNLLPPTALFRGNGVEQQTYAGLIDDSPTVGVNGIAQLDDDDLNFGLVGGIGDDASGPHGGTLAHDYGRDGAGSLTLTGATLPAGLGFSSVVSDGGRTLTISQNGVDVLRVTLSDATSGQYTIDQLAAIRHPEGDNENNIAINIGYRVADRDGDFVNGTLTINIDDDSPVASDSSVSGLDDEDTVHTNYHPSGEGSEGSEGSQGGEGGEGSEGSEGDAANVTHGNLSYKAGADGLRDLDFAALDGKTAGFKAIHFDALGDSLQEAVHFAWNGASRTLTAIGNDSGNTVFSLVIDNPATGHFTLTMNSPLVHSDLGETQDLLITLPFTVTDGDGDTATANLSIAVKDDMPVVTVSPAASGEGGTPLSVIQLNLDETFTNKAGDTNGELDNRNSAFSAANLTTDVTASAGKAFGQLSTAQGQEGGPGGLESLFSSSVSLGADGGTIARQFGLVLSGAGAEGEAPSGVQTTLVATDVVGTALANLSEAQRTIYLFQEADGSVTGRIGGANGYIALRITLSDAANPSSAAMTVQQLIPLEHGNPALHDEQIPLQLVGANGEDAPALSIAYTVTATDGDGDVVSKSASVVLADENTDNTSAGIVFDDDGPALTVNVNSQFALSHDETLGAQSDANDAGFVGSLALSQLFTGVANPGHDADGVFGLPLGFARSTGSALTIGNVDYGSDGAAHSGALVYTLGMTAVGGAVSTGPLDSGLWTTEGKPISLFLENGLIVGRYDANGNGVDGSDPAAFALHIDPATGIVAMVQYVSLDNPNSADADDTVDLSHMLGQLNVTLTATDGDGDTSTVTADIGGAVRFQDDGPTLFIAGNRDFQLTADESAGLQGNDVAGPLAVFAGVSNVGGVALAYATDSDAAVNIVPLYGVDGPASANAVAYQLQVGGTASGLSLTDGTPISLHVEDGLIVGRVDSGVHVGQAVFALAIDPATGQVSVVQYLSLEHTNTTSSNELIHMATGSIAVAVTITDGDGDSVTKTLDLSGKIGFRDDGPKVVAEASVHVVVDEDGLHAPALSDGNADGGRTGEVTGTGLASATGGLSALINFGADGLGSFGLEITAPANSSLTSMGQTVLIVSDGTTLHGYVEIVGGAGYQAGDRLVFTLTLAADGTYSFTLNDQIDHPTLNGLAGDNSENLLGTQIDLSKYVIAMDGDGDRVNLPNGTFTVDVRDDIPVVTARDAVVTEITHTQTNSYALQAGNVDIRGMNGQGDFDIRLTAALNGAPESVNTSSNNIGIGNGQRIDGAEVLTLDFIKSFNQAEPLVNGGSYDVNAVRFSIDVSEGHQINTSIVFLSARNDGAFVDFDLTINGAAAVPLAPVYVGGALAGYTFSVPDGAVVVATGKAGAHFDSVDIGNYSGHQFDSTQGNVTLNGGNPFKVSGIESDTVVTETVTETFKIVHDETLGVNAAADPNGANDVSGLGAPAALAGALGYAQSGVSVLAAGGLFAGSVGADEAGHYSFAITDKDGHAISGVSSGLKTISGAAITLSTDADGTLIGSAGGQTVFKVLVAADGVVWIAQYQSIAHAIAGDSAAAYDDVARLMADLHVTATLTDFDGDAVSKTSPVALQVEFQDDGPKVNADVDSISQDSSTAATGNVVTGSYSAAVLGAPDDGNGTNGVADAPGADGFGGIAWTGAGGGHVNGLYGQLSVDAQGNYVYRLYTAAENAGAYQAVQALTPGQTLSEQFAYTLTDGDGDTAQSKLTITVNGADDGVIIRGLDSVGGDVVVDESGLPARAGESAGSAASGNSEVGTGSFSFEAPDGLKSITIGGSTITALALTGASSASPIIVTPALDEPNFGRLEIIGFTPSASGGTVSYRFVLTDNLTTHPDTVTSDGDGNSGAADQIVGGAFTVTVTDSNDSIRTAHLSVAVNDDAPLAGPATPVVVAENSTTIGTLGFVPGADSGQVTHVGGQALIFDANGWSQTFDSADGHLRVKADGQFEFKAPDDPYKSGVNQFSFTVTDADGDSVQTVLNLTVTDNIQTNFFTLDDVTVLENGTFTYTAHMNYAAQEPVTVTLNNGVTITFAPGELTSHSEPQLAPSDDVYKDGTNVDLSISSVTGGNFEAVNHADTATLTILDTIDTVTATLSATPSTSEDGGSITYTVTLSGGPGAVDPDTNLVFNLSNNQQVTILAGQTSGTLTVPVNADDVYKETATIGASITSVASGGTEYESLVIDHTPVSTTIVDDVDVVTATLTAGAAVFDATGVIIPYTVTLSAGLSPFAPTGGAALTFTLTDGTQVVLDVSEISKTVNVHYNFGFTNPITNAISGVTGAEEFEKLVTAGATSITTNSVPEVKDGTSSLTVYEAALDTTKDGSDLVAGSKTGSNPSSTGETATDANTLVFHATGEAITSITFATPAGMGGALANLATGTATWALSGGDRTLTLSIDGQPALVLGLTGATTASAATDATVSVTATLVSNFAHLSNSVLDVILSGVTVQATDVSGDKVFGNVAVTIVDDTPVANSDAKSLAEGSAPSKSDLVLIVDVSGSMDYAVPNTGHTRMELALAALQELVSNSSVDEVKIIRFSDSSSATVWMSKADALAFIADASHFKPNGGTNYDAALFTGSGSADNAFDIPPTTTGDHRAIYFISDGEPTDPSGSVGIGTSEESAWIQFLTNNNVEKVTTVGIGGLNAANANTLEPIAWAPGELQGTIGTAANDPNVLIIADGDFTALGQTLASALPNVSTGNILTDNSGGAVADSFGADGGRILSIAINGTTYTWDGANTITKTGATTGTLSGTSMSVGTSLGGTMGFFFKAVPGHAAGDWNYTAPTELVSTTNEVFSYVLRDNDGDTAGANITVTVTAVNDAPINTVPGAQTTNEDTAKSVTGLSITDVDAGSSSLTVKLSVLNGTLNVSGGTAGISGNGTALVTLTGTVAAINSTLAAIVTYNPNANYNGTDTLKMETSDNGNTGSGGTLTDTDTVAIIINAVNDLPTTNADQVITNVGAGQAVAIPESWLLANDTDVEGSALDVTNPVVSAGTGTVSHSAGGIGTGTVTFTDNATLGGSFTYQATDGSAGAAATVTVNNNPTSVTTLIGGAGSQIIIGGSTNDILQGGAGNDFLNGGSGIDQISFADATGGVVFTLTQSASDTVVNMTAVGLGIDTYRNMEGVIGSAFADTLTGSSGADVITGGGGNDTLAGAGGNDTYVFGLTDGSDVITDTAGTDAIVINSGGAALASLSFLDNNKNNNTGDLVIGFNGQQITVVGHFAAGGVETIRFGDASYAGYSLGSGDYNLNRDDSDPRTGSSGNDVIAAAAEANSLSGGAGNDLLFGNAGNDTLTGGTGSDLLVGGGGADVFAFSAGDSELLIGGLGTSGTISGYDVIADFAPGLNAAGSEKISFSGASIVANGLGNGTNSALSLNTGFVVGSHSVTNGIVTFDDTSAGSASGFAAAVALSSMADVAAAVQYLQGIDFGNAGASVAFKATIGSVIHTFVFTQGANNGANASDVLIDLYKVDATSISVSGNQISVTGTVDADPIILDLHGNGFSFSGVTDGAAFDINADGVKDQMAWNRSSDGILAMDLNHDGLINDGTEIFSPSFRGGNFASGGAALASLDTNHDGKITSADADFDKLVIWQDANADGITDPGELSSLADNGIVSLSASTNPATGEIDGQAVVGQGSFERADGTIGSYVEMALDTVFGIHGSDVQDFLVGTDGDDILIGGFGSDTLTGGNGADTFVFDSFDAADLIADYGTDDKIDLTALFEDATPADPSEYVRYDHTTGVLQVDADGAGAGSFQTVATVTADVGGHPDTITILFDDVTANPHTVIL